MLTVHNFNYGLITPGLAYVMSFLGAFIGLRCTTRAYAYEGRARVRWLAGAAIAARHYRYLGYAFHRHARLHHSGHDDPL